MPASPPSLPAPPTSTLRVSPGVTAAAANTHVGRPGRDPGVTAAETTRRPAGDDLDLGHPVGHHELLGPAGEVVPDGLLTRLRVSGDEGQGPRQAEGTGRDEDTATHGTAFRLDLGPPHPARSAPGARSRSRPPASDPGQPV